MTNKITKIPQIRFNDFTEDWEQRKLIDVADILGGGTPSTTILDYWDGEIDWYSPVEIGEQVYVNGSQKKLTELGLKKSSAKVLPVGTVLFTSRAGIGKTAILAKEGATNQGFQSIVPHKNALDSYFIYSRTNELKRYGEIQGAGSTFVEVSGKQMAKMPILIPILEEQIKIGGFFKQLDNTIALHQRQYDLLIIIKQSYLQKLFPKKGRKYPEIRFEDFEKKWEQYKLGEIGKTFTGLSGKTKDDFGHGYAKFITYMNVYKNAIAAVDGMDSIEIDPKQNEVRFGDVLFTTSSETQEEVGMSSVWMGNDNNIYLNSFCFGFRPDMKFNEYYLAYILRSPFVRRKFIFLAQGISRYNISKSKVMDIEISAPELEEQNKIGLFFKNLDEAINLHHQNLENLKQMKKSLLQKMFV
ncbi:restriction endonuclease subunit S [Enterococcus eurekensis]|uniref:Restriction endonuclease subunit S n=1 Tax=Enterococcus eurekensis TaxID=1159753 RepID=A0ABV9M5Q6_9ENTE